MGDELGAGCQGVAEESSSLFALITPRWCKWCQPADAHCLKFFLAAPGDRPAGRHPNLSPQVGHRERGEGARARAAQLLRDSTRRGGTVARGPAVGRAGPRAGASGRKVNSNKSRPETGPESLFGISKEQGRVEPVGPALAARMLLTL